MLALLPRKGSRGNSEGGTRAGFPHRRLGAVKRVAPESILEQVICIFGRGNDRIGLQNARRKCLPFYPERVRGVIRRGEHAQVFPIVDSAIESIMSTGYLVYKLTGMCIDVDKLANVRAVRHLDLPG